MENQKDERNPLSWAELEEKIQKRNNTKDKDFMLSGPWKKFIRVQDGFMVYAVDGEWVRSNLSVIFGHGGHGFVHEFIPNYEIWIDTNHCEDCGCVIKEPNQPVSQNYFDSTIIHEIEEFRLMEKGMNFYDAHQLALKKEVEAGILKDPYNDIE